MGYKNIFLDTNIILDFLNNQRAEHSKAVKLIEKLMQKSYKITISEDMLSTIYYIEKDKTKVLKFFAFIKDRWQIVPFGSKTVAEALNFSLQSGIDLEDALQCFCAKNSGCEVLITSDKTFVECGIKILSYNEILGGEDGL